MSPLGTKHRETRKHKDLIGRLWGVFGNESWSRDTLTCTTISYAPGSVKNLETKQAFEVTAASASSSNCWRTSSCDGDHARPDDGRVLSGASFDGQEVLLMQGGLPFACL
eukprot:s3573_g3.t3